MLGFEIKRESCNYSRQETLFSEASWNSFALVKSIQLPRLNVFVICFSFCSVMRRLFQTSAIIARLFPGMCFHVWNHHFNIFTFFMLLEFSFFLWSFSYFTTYLKPALSFSFFWVLYNYLLGKGIRDWGKLSPIFLNRNKNSESQGALSTAPESLTWTQASHQGLSFPSYWPRAGNFICIAVLLNIKTLIYHKHPRPILSE